MPFFARSIIIVFEGTKPRVRVDCTTEGVTAGKELSVKYEKMSKSKHNGVDPVMVLEQVRKGIGVRDEVLGERAKFFKHWFAPVGFMLLDTFTLRKKRLLRFFASTFDILNRPPSLHRMVSISLDCNCWILPLPEHQLIGENLVRWREILLGIQKG